MKANGKLLYNTASPTLVLCDNLEGWDRVEGRRELQEGGDICISVADSCCCTAEANTIL